MLWNFDPYNQELPEGIDECRIDPSGKYLILYGKGETDQKEQMYFSFKLDAEWLIKLAFQVMNDKGCELFEERGVQSYVAKTGRRICKSSWF